MGQMKIKTVRCEGCKKEIIVGIMGPFRYDNKIFKNHRNMHKKRVCTECSVMMSDCYIYNNSRGCKYCRGNLPIKWEIKNDEVPNKELPE